MSLVSKLKLTWSEFVELAQACIGRYHLGATGKLMFYKRNTYEPDMEMYDYPDYVEIEIKGEKDGKTQE